MFGSWLRSSDKSGKPKKTLDSLLLPFKSKERKVGSCLGQIHKRVKDNGESNWERERERGQCWRWKRGERHLRWGTSDKRMKKEEMRKNKRK